MLCISFVSIHCTPKSIHSSGFEMLENGWSSREARTGSGSGGNPNEFFSVHRLWKARLKFNCFHFNSACFRLRTFLFCFELMLKICSDECPLIMSSANLTFGKLSYGASFFLFRPLWNVKVQTRSSKVKYYCNGSLPFICCVRIFSNNFWNFTVCFCLFFEKIFIILIIPGS